MTLQNAVVLLLPFGKSIAPGRVRARGFINDMYVSKLLAEHRSGKRTTLVRCGR